jgi:hypothetical protein
VSELPAIRIATRWFEGEQALAAATALMRAPSVYGSPLAPAS